MWIELGTAGEWAAAIGTVAAFGVTLRVVKIEANRDAERTMDRRREAAELVRAHADLVHAWVLGPWQLHSSMPTQTVLLSNTSAQPVRDVRLVLRYSEQSETMDLGVLAPNADSSRDVRVSFVPNEGALPDVTLVFRDRSGRVWMREGGDLKLLSGNSYDDEDLHRLLKENPAT